MRNGGFIRRQVLLCDVQWRFCGVEFYGGYEVFLANKLFLKWFLCSGCTWCVWLYMVCVVIYGVRGCMVWWLYDGFGGCIVSVVVMWWVWWLYMGVVVI